MLCFCIYCVTIFCGFGFKKSDIMRVMRVRVAGATMKCDMIAVFSTTGVDGVHLSAGAEDGNSVQCQVEHCPDRLYR